MKAASHTNSEGTSVLSVSCCPYVDTNITPQRRRLDFGFFYFAAKGPLVRELLS